MKATPIDTPSPGDRIDLNGQIVTCVTAHRGNAYTVQFPDGTTAAIAMDASTRIVARNDAADGSEAGNGGIGAGRGAGVELAGIERGW